MRLPAGTLLALLLVVTAGCVSPLQGSPPESTVENRDETSYRVVVYTTTDDIHEKTGFYATTETGERRLVGFRDVVFSHGYRNVTIADETGTTMERFTVEANSTATRTIDGWEQGDQTIYLVETLDGELVFAKLVECEKQGQSHWIRILSKGSVKSGSTCN